MDFVACYDESLLVVVWSLLNFEAINSLEIRSGWSINKKCPLIQVSLLQLSSSYHTISIFRHLMSNAFVENQI